METIPSVSERSEIREDFRLTQSFFLCFENPSGVFKALYHLFWWIFAFALTGVWRMAGRPCAG